MWVFFCFFFSSRRRHTRCSRDWSSDVCSSDLPQRDLLVIVDEAALPLGTFRFRARGSSAGHNGLKSIEGALGHQDYARLRVGIGPPAGRNRGDLADYVLSEFGKGDAKVVKELMPT